MRTVLYAPKRTKHILPIVTFSHKVKSKPYLYQSFVLKYLCTTHEFELKFPKLSQAELKSFRAKSSQAGHFNFRAETELEFF